MTIEFTNLNQEEKDMLLDFEKKNPEEIVILDVVASFDGFNGMKLITDLGPAVISGVVAIVNTILNRKKKTPSQQPPIIVVIIDGCRKEILNAAEINIYGESK